MNRSRSYLSRHAWRRAHARGISLAAIDAALDFGRPYRSHRATVYRLDRRTIRAAQRHGHDLFAYEGVHVVEAVDGTIITTYRSRQPPRILR